MNKRLIAGIGILFLISLVVGVGITVFYVTRSSETKRAVQMTGDYCKLDLRGLPKGVDCNLLADTYLKLYRDHAVECSKTYANLDDFGWCILDHYSDAFYAARGAA